MPVVVFALVAGLVVGAARGGKVAGLGVSPLRWNVTALAGVGFAGAAQVLGLDGASPLLLTGHALMISWALGNLARPGMAVVLIGLLANLVPIAANDGMPVRPGALVGAGVISEAQLTDQLDVGGGRHLERPSDRAVILSDIVPVPVAGFRSVVSFGDLIVAAGLASVIANGMQTRRRRVSSHVTRSSTSAGTSLGPPPDVETTSPIDQPTGRPRRPGASVTVVSPA